MRMCVALLCLLFPIAVAGEGEQFNYEKYRADLSNAEREIDYRNEILKSDQQHLMLPEQSVPSETKGEDKPSGPTKTDIKSAQPRPAPQTSAEPEKPTQPAPETAHERSVKKKNPYRYFPPSAKGDKVVKVNLSGDDFNNVKRRFGIPIGTKIRVRLNATASNVQTGYIQFQVLDDVIGDIKVLYRGAQLFGRASAVKGSPRVFTRITKGITSDHEEFTLRASVSDARHEAGLAGTIVNDGKAVPRAVSEGALALGEAATALLPTDAGAAAAGAVADSLIDEKRQESSAKLGGPAFIVVAQPQDAYVYVEETF